jgi:hypothetical protein
MIDTEDKQAWCEAAIADEEQFVNQRLPFLGLDGFINPEKAADKYTHDLFVRFPSDLKSVRTPFFKAGERYGIDPQYAVTFNVKDGQRYRRLYPNILVIFDVNWETTCKVIAGNVYEVQPMHRTYCGFLKDISNAIKQSGCHSVEYTRRVGDTNGNGKVSWVFDVRHLHEVGVG